MNILEKSVGYVEENKSKFYSFAFPINNVEDFKELLKQIKKEFPKAKHIVYAYRIGQASKSCDDQEPKGTAGRPLLELLNKRDINNCVIFVARHYGGVKLGAGKLLRTYVNAGISCLNNAKFN